MLFLYKSIMVVKTWTTIDSPKILEKAVNSQLQQCVKTFDILSPTQSGFRQHHSTESAVTYFTDEIRRNADAGRLTDASFVDLKRVFDGVPHEELISKLEQFGFVDNSIAWFTNYLSIRSQVVSLGGKSVSSSTSGKWSTTGKHSGAGVVYIVY